MDGDGVVVMCYIEVCMIKIIFELLCDINKDIIDFIDNYDGNERELLVLFVWFFNLLVNGVLGIVVGMVMNILLYNLIELINGVFSLSKNFDILIVELMEDIEGFDFFIVGFILGKSGIRCVYEIGCGLI